jgi:hypothetical protein
VNDIAVRIGAATGACAVLAGIAVGALAAQNPSGGSISAEPTDITQTTQVAPSTPLVPVAEPSITGPAPLPSEEQGLPG